MNLLKAPPLKLRTRIRKNQSWRKIYMRENSVSTPLNWGFPSGTVVKNMPANAGDTGSSPGLGRSHMPQSN